MPPGSCMEGMQKISDERRGTLTSWNPKETLTLPG
jgi:hypothetical protein